MNEPPKKIKVLLRDSQFIAVHKPHGIATYQESRDGNAMGCKEILEEQFTERLFPVHRIDADTSGIVLFALNSKTASALIRAFKEHQMNKTYVAWCVGNVPTKGSIKTPLKKNKSNEMEPARTDFERIRTEKNCSFVRLFPYTGRFHQLRRHLLSIGHPIVGDPLYGDPKGWAHFFKGEPRLLLQAEELEFYHPVTGRPLVIKTKERL